MKRLCSIVVCGLATVAVLMLSGCNRAPSNGAADSTDQTPGNAEAQETDHEPAFKPQTGHLVSSSEIPLLEQINRENERVVAAASPAVVRIIAVGPVDPHAQLFGDLPFKIPGLPHNVRSTAPSYGSGVVISKDGLIVTNAHVVEDAQTLEVQLRDQRAFPARVVAKDESWDIAVLKIAASDLTPLPWGNSDKVEVGEQVFAIGNPFDLDDSVSKGIVSAKGRNLPDSTSYEDYIQTDAAINPGNSGGPLINIHGELIGINAAIASYNRVNDGVGFSIPSNLVRYAVQGLLKDGKLTRGYLGVRLPTKIDGGVAEQLGLEANHGALLAGVQRSSPADTAKLRPVDFITGVDGHKINSVSELRLIVAQIPIGKQVAVNFIRGGEPQSTTLKIAELPKSAEASPDAPPIDPTADVPAPGPTTQPAPGDHVLSGTQVTDLNDKSRQRYGIDDMITSGVVVTAVAEGSPADLRGLVRGDVIEIACAHRGLIQPLSSSNDFAGLTQKLKADQSVVLLVHHGRTSGSDARSSIFMFLTPQLK
jgi:serine protease Do